jgi:hypothetical protein
MGEPKIQSFAPFVCRRTEILFFSLDLSILPDSDKPLVRDYSKSYPSAY